MFGDVPGTWKATEMPINTYQDTEGKLYSVDLSRYFAPEGFTEVSSYLWSPPELPSMTSPTLGGKTFNPAALTQSGGTGTRKDIYAPFDSKDRRTMLTSQFTPGSMTLANLLGNEAKAKETRYARTP